MWKKIYKWFCGVGIIQEADFAVLPYNTKFQPNSTEEYPWRHPPGYPYQVYGGVHAPEERRGVEQVWTKLHEIEGYKLTEDYYSDRLYFTPIRERVL